jgi:hypothetical protein
MLSRIGFQRVAKAINGKHRLRLVSPLFNTFFCDSRSIEAKRNRSQGRIYDRGLTRSLSYLQVNFLHQL